MNESLKPVNVYNAIIGIIAVICGFLLKVYYRPYAYQKNIPDFGIADGAPSFFYVIGFSQLLLLR